MRGKSRKVDKDIVQFWGYRKENGRLKKEEVRQWGCSSAGRAPALHAGGQEFDPLILHHGESQTEHWRWFFGHLQQSRWAKRQARKHLENWTMNNLLIIKWKRNRGVHRKMDTQLTLRSFSKTERVNYNFKSMKINRETRKTFLQSELTM